MNPIMMAFPLGRLLMTSLLGYPSVFEVLATYMYPWYKTVFVLVVAISRAIGTPDECVPPGDLKCVFDSLSGFINVQAYYLLTNGTRCNAGCMFPLYPDEVSGEICPISQPSRRSIPDLYRRKFLPPPECKQFYFLYIDVGKRMCRLHITYNKTCDNVSWNN